jgi:hypothetical protein
MDHSGALEKQANSEVSRKSDGKAMTPGGVERPLVSASQIQSVTSGAGIGSPLSSIAQPASSSAPSGPSQRATPDQRYSLVRMPTKPTPFHHPNPHEREPLDTVHSRVIFCVGADRFAIDFIGTVTELKPRPAEVIPICKKSSAKRRRVGSVGTAGLPL